MQGTLLGLQSRVEVAALGKSMVVVVKVVRRHHQLESPVCVWMWGGQLCRTFCRNSVGTGTKAQF